MAVIGSRVSNEVTTAMCMPCACSCASSGDHDISLGAGGGSGHEPAMAGLVGDGLLAAAAAGDMFASPSAEAVLAALRTVTGPAGALCLVLNYTGVVPLRLS